MTERRDPAINPNISALLERSNVTFGRVKNYGALSHDDLRQLRCDLTDIAREASKLAEDLSGDMHDQGATLASEACAAATTPADFTYSSEPSA